MHGVSIQALIASSEDVLVRRFSAALSEIGVLSESVPHTGKALSSISSRHFEALILDCDLEGGMDLVELIRQEPVSYRSVVFALVSSSSAARDATKSGANFVLNKPVNWEFVKRTLRAAQTMIIRERRKSVREKIRAAARITHRKQQSEATIVDLSETGMAIQTEQSFETGNILEISFMLPGYSKEIRCAGRVARAQLTGQVGIEFQYLSDAAANAIRKWIIRHSPRGNKNSD